MIQATDHITVLGTTGTGKSTLARKINKMWPRTIILDPVSDWTDGEIFYSFSRLTEKLINLKKINSKKFKLIFRFNPDEENTEDVFNHVIRLAYHFGGLQVVIDEIQLFSSPHKIPNYLKNLIFTGRHQKVSFLAITQRPGQLNKSVLSQSRHIFCGQLHEKNDLRVVSDFLNIEINKIINLKKGEFLHFSPGEEIKLINSFGKNNSEK